MIVSDEQLERAMKYLADTDDKEALLFSEVTRTSENWKNIKGAMYLGYDNGTVVEKEARAANSIEANAALSEHLKAIHEHREVLNKRKRAILTIDVWRSINANRRQGT